jgi:hypothetical protein
MRISHAFPLILAIITGISFSASAENNGRIYGTVETRGHAEVLAKWNAASKSVKPEKIDYAAKSGYGGGTGGGNYSAGDAGSSDAAAINYQELADIFVVLVHPTWQGGTVHEVELSPYGLDVGVLALAKGDIIRLHNKTDNSYTPYLAGEGDNDIQDFSPMEPGSVSDLVIELTGDLELGLDEDEEELITIVSGIGWKGQRVSSGEHYEFKGLEAGNYSLTFWYWRLGSLDHAVSLKAGQNVEINEVLSVDRIIN